MIAFVQSGILLFLSYQSAEKVLFAAIFTNSILTDFSAYLIQYVTNRVFGIFTPNKRRNRLFQWIAIELNRLDIGRNIQPSHVVSEGFKREGGGGCSVNKFVL